MMVMQFELHTLQTCALEWMVWSVSRFDLFVPTGHLLDLSTQQVVDAGKFAPPDKSRPRLLTLEFTVPSSSVHCAHLTTFYQTEQETKRSFARSLCYVRSVY